MRFELHPFAEFLPTASDEEYYKIREDIRRNGLRVPILLFNGQVLDGRTRLKACLEVKARLKVDHFYGSPMDALRQVQSLNVYRRHLNQGQKAFVAARIAEELQRQENLTAKEAQSIAAMSVGASVSSTREAATIQRANPEAADAVLNGKKTLESAKKDVRPTSAQIRSVRYLSSAMSEIRHSLNEMQRRRCPEQKRLEKVLQELEDIHDKVEKWAERKIQSG